MLPEHLMHKILFYLPLKDIIRTSILSRQWRYRWTKIPILVFGKGNGMPVSKSKLIRAIDQVLLLHNAGVIQVLQLDGIHQVPDIDRWILHASRRSIQQLLIEIDDDQVYTVPSSVYTCDCLITLSLSHCLLRRAPSSFKGFKKLTCLVLRQTTLTQRAFEKLVSSSPLLEKLILANCKGLRNLKIKAPNLRIIDIGGVFANITFGCRLSKLSEISIDLKDTVEYEYDEDVESWMVQFFTRLPAIKRLEVKNYFLKYFAVGPIPERLPTPLPDLYHLTICINLKNPDENSVALGLFKSSPNLTELEIQGCASGGVDDEDVESSIIWVDDSKCHCPFEKLQSVKISDVSGTRVELELMKFLLANSPSLEKLIIIPYVEELSSDFLKDMLRLRRASARAEIYFV